MKEQGKEERAEESLLEKSQGGEHPCYQLEQRPLDNSEGYNVIYQNLQQK